VAKPDKTDLLNMDVANSMKAWARATIDLDRERERDHHGSGRLSVEDAVLNGPSALRELFKNQGTGRRFCK